MDASGHQQNASRLPGRAGHLRISAYHGRRYCTVNKQHELHGQALRISYFQPAQQFAEPGAALVLEGESDLVGGMARLFQLGDGVHERTTAKSVVGKAALELIEISQDLLCPGVVRRLRSV